MKTKLLVGAGLSAFALALAAKDAVIMTVNGEDVPQSEFEYLYNKNSQQQLNPQPIDEYVDMFKLYKLKVADARAEGLDTLESFRREMAQYKHDLALPYITDSVYVNSLLKEAHDRAAEEVEAYHIMLLKSRDASQNPALKQKIDSIHTVLKNGGDFAALAAQYSQDRGSNQNGGRMGYIGVQMYPYNFETTAFSLSEGEISDVIETPVGYHVLKGGKHRQARGKVLASHILLMTKGDEAVENSQKVVIDSIYNVAVADPTKFGDLARKYSDDKNSGRNDGKLPWFGAGEMVAEFDSVAFAMPVGTISKPFKTRFGWHIVNKLDTKGVPSIEEMRPGFMAAIGSAQDPRYMMVRDNRINKLSKRHKASLSDKVLEAMKADVRKSGLDSLFVEKWTGAVGKTPLCFIDNKGYMASDAVSRIRGYRQQSPVIAEEMLENAVLGWYDGLLVEAEEDLLLTEKPEYANLYKEYVDGSLLYEVSVNKVWDRASKDEEGLKAYFEKNRNKYAWSEPRAKGYLVQAINDSVADLVKARAVTVGRDTLVNTIRKEFPRQVSIMKVLEPKGSNAMVDNVLFGGPKASTSSSNYTVYFMIDPRVITAPEELLDVRGQVTGDYQNDFQAAWEQELLNRYPVKVNEKILKKVKSKYAKK